MGRGELHTCDLPALSAGSAGILWRTMHLRAETCGRWEWSGINAPASVGSRRAPDDGGGSVVKTALLPRTTLLHVQATMQRRQSERRHSVGPGYDLFATQRRLPSGRTTDARDPEGGDQMIPED